MSVAENPSCKIPSVYDKWKDLKKEERKKASSDVFSQLTNMDPVPRKIDSMLGTNKREK